ncbi:MAG: hypothetical protein LAT66_06600 [Alkalimonas sp.]|nr:hypothetical protein [Alkalimonas sp.]
MPYNVPDKAACYSAAALLILSSCLWSGDIAASEQAATHQVQPGDTLWRIASKLRPSHDVSVPQVMLALFESNPDAFMQQDINQLQHGHWLTVPDEAQIAQYDATEALQLAAEARVSMQARLEPAATLPSEPDKAKAQQAQPLDASTVEPDIVEQHRVERAADTTDSVADAEPKHVASDSSSFSYNRNAPAATERFWSDIEWYSQLNLMQRAFGQRGLQQQGQWQSAVSLEMEWYWQSDDRSHTVVVSPYLRWDQQDSNRHLVDLAEAYWLYYGSGWEIRTGVNKVFWGAVESQRLVDIINQRDLLDRPDGESKLGQPMMQLSLIRDFGTVHAYLLPYFRERAFAGTDGRLRLPQLVDTSNPVYESSSEQRHLDWAVRWSQQFSGLDLGLSYFQGTSREPALMPTPEGTLRPYYPQLKQLGLDGQWILGSWLWKMEAVYRDSQIENYSAFTSGFEYTQIGINDRFWDLGWLVEYQYDSRGLEATAIGQNDVFVGWRLALNDAAGSEILFGIIQDLDRSSSRSAYLEASTRLSDRFRLRVDGWFFDSKEPDDLVYWLRKDDYIQLTLEYYF